MAWEFLYYIPNPNYPIEDDGDCSSHFGLILPDSYKQAEVASDPSFKAVALVTRHPRTDKYLTFRPHTASCSCSRRPGDVSTKVVNRSGKAKAGPFTLETPCVGYWRTNPENKGSFEPWEWQATSCIPLQAPKMIHIDALHLMRARTQRDFGVMLDLKSVLVVDELLKQFEPPPSCVENIVVNASILNSRRSSRRRTDKPWRKVARVGIETK